MTDPRPDDAPPPPRARVLVVDDDATVAEVAARYLQREGYATAVAADGPGALARAEAWRPDVVVLDRMLPGMDGTEVLRRLRERTEVAVILLTALAAEADRVAGLDLGADDYVTKPFSPRELTARVRAVLRRRQPAAPAERARRLRAGPLELDPQARRLWVRGAEVPTTAREFDLLAFFVRHPGQAFRRDELLERVWGWTIGDTSTVTVHVRHLREKVEEDPSSPTLLSTVWSVGYRFDPPPEEQADAPAVGPGD